MRNPREIYPRYSQPPLGLINNGGMQQERPPEHLSPLRSVQNRKQINKPDNAHHSFRANAPGFARLNIHTHETSQLGTRVPPPLHSTGSREPVARHTARAPDIPPTFKTNAPPRAITVALDLFIVNLLSVLSG